MDGSRNKRGARHTRGDEDAARRDPGLAQHCMQSIAATAAAAPPTAASPAFAPAMVFDKTNLIDGTARFIEASRAALAGTPTDFVVVGVLGLAGAGASTVLAALHPRSCTLHQ